MLLAGVTGVSIGSHVADRLQKTNKAGRSTVVMFAALTCVPLILIGFSIQSAGLALLLFFFLGVMFFSFYFGPVSAIIHDITHPKVRATAFAVYVFVVHLVGQASGPTVVGKLSDMTDLRFAMQMATLVLLAGAVAFIPVVYRIRKGHVELHEDE